MRAGYEKNINLVCDVYKITEIAEIVSSFAPDFEIYQTEQLPWGGHFQGLAGAQQFFGKLRENVDSTVEIEEIYPVEEKIIVKGRTRGTVLQNEKKFDVSIVHIWTIRDGKLAKFEPFIDTPAMLAALQ